ncbi:MAG: SDR family NAD(P)-dependent oxidoreductase [Anaerolineae bacterium]|jgi:NAD(P)-dependent dehydrogenase (short-subunit alcohol dehydrogenase family)|nr:SDR family NAD(P)-dependent oxidoreductase [Anaerolineae bacterium]
MPGETSPVRKYWSQYKWSNIAAMVRNSMADPDIYNEDCAGRLIVITGATSGIGYETARKYASRGAHLLTINRNKDKSEALREELKRDFDITCDYLIADLSRLADMHSVGQALAEMNASIDVLIHNAGIFLSNKVLTEDGLEMTFATNFLASFVINNLVEEKLKSQRQARILLVNSEGYRFAVWGLRLDDINWNARRYTGLRAYGASKLAQLLTMMVFHDRYSGSGVTINAMHPGMVTTNTGRDNGPLYKWYKRNVIDRVSKPASISAEALYYLGLAPMLANVSGEFFNLTRAEELAPPARDKGIAENLWRISLEMGGLK